MMTASKANRRRGSALIAALIVVLLVGGLTGAYVRRALTRSQEQVDLSVQEGALRGLEGAIGMKIAQLMKSSSDLSPVYGALAASTGSVGANVRWAVEPSQVAGDSTLLFIGGAAGSGNVQKRVAMIVKKPVQPLQGGLPAALRTYGGNLALSNNININGNDHTINGNEINSGGTNELAIQMTSGTVTDSKNTQLAGNGTSGQGTTAVTNPSIVGVVSDTGTYPTEPDQTFQNLAPGTLKKTAQAMGTYFTNATDFTNYMNAYLAANNNQIPGGVILYLDFNITNAEILDYPNAEMNSTPSVFINHYDGSTPANGVPTGTSDLGNVHIAFKGLMIFDSAKHFNAQSSILGGMVSLSNGAANGNVFANGGFSLNYSTDVLASLPSVQVDGAPYQVVLWTETGPLLNQQPVLDCVNYVNGGSSYLGTPTGSVTIAAQ